MQQQIATAQPNGSRGALTRKLSKLAGAALLALASLSVIAEDFSLSDAEAAWRRGGVAM
jgi:hypothetical protein